MQREIESHFERLLNRRRLHVHVWDADAPSSAPLVCHPIDYAALSPGASVRTEVELGGGQVAECNLCVLPSGGRLGVDRDVEFAAEMHQVHTPAHPRTISPDPHAWILVAARMGLRKDLRTEPHGAPHDPHSDPHSDPQPPSSLPAYGLPSPSMP